MPATNSKPCDYILFRYKIKCLFILLKHSYDFYHYLVGGLVVLGNVGILGCVGIAKRRDKIIKVYITVINSCIKLPYIVIARGVVKFVVY